MVGLDPFCISLGSAAVGKPPETTFYVFVDASLYVRIYRGLRLCNSLFTPSIPPLCLNCTYVFAVSS